MDLGGLAQIPRRKRLHHFRYLPRNNVGNDADNPLCTYSHERQRKGIISAQDFKLGPASRPQLTYAIGIPTALFAPLLAVAIFIGVAALWIVPDRRYERIVAG